MAITKEYIGKNFDSDYLSWLEDKLVPDYVDSIEANEGETEYSLIKDGNTIAKVTASSWTLYANSNGGYSDSTILSVGSQSTSNVKVYGYITSHAVAIQFSATNGEGKTGVLIFTKGNNGDTICVGSNTLSSTSSSATQITLGVSYKVVSYKDDVTNIVTSSEARYNAGNFTCIIPFVFNSSDGNTVYTPYVFWCSMYQFSTPATLDIGGVKYVSFGSWLLKDE